MRIIFPMSDDRKPNPMDDLSEGLGLLLRAAKGAAKPIVDRVEKLPSDNLENFVTEGVKEVGRALETVGTVIEREVMGHKKPDAKPGSSPPPADATAAPSKDAVDAVAAAPPPDDEPPKGPRVA